MSWLAAFLLAQAAPALELPAAQDSENEIIVLGQKLSEVRADWATRRRNGRTEIRRCKIVQSSGDKELDRVVCKAVRKCAPQIPPDAHTGDPLTEFYACTKEHSLALGEELFARREAKGGRGR